MLVPTKEPSIRYTPFCDLKVKESVAPLRSAIATPRDAAPSVALPAVSTPAR